LEQNMMSLKARGFTLIELVVVITILGILAAFAIPKFVALDQQARFATITGLGGSVKSAAALARSLSMATSITTVANMEGTSVTLSNNYPDSSLTGIAAAVNTSATDFTFAAGTGTTTPAVWTKVGAPTTCTVSYTAALTGAVPVVLVAAAIDC
jgi:MSHA pilin protein MshA